MFQLGTFNVDASCEDFELLRPRFNTVNIYRFPIAFYFWHYL